MKLHKCIRKIFLRSKRKFILGHPIKINGEEKKDRKKEEGKRRKGKEEGN